MSASVYIGPEIAAVRALYAPLLTTDLRKRSVKEQLASQVALLLEAHAAGDPAVRFQIASWLPGAARSNLDEIMARAFGPQDARLTVAREHGFRDWADVESLNQTAPDSDFEDAVDAALGGDTDRLDKLLKVQPSLASGRSVFGHKATLLHYMASNGVESWRQVTPLNGAAIIARLIEASTDVNAEAPIYGGSRPLGLLETSAHPRAAGVAEAMAQQLRNAGAH